MAGNISDDGQSVLNLSEFYEIEEDGSEEITSAEADGGLEEDEYQVMARGLGAGDILRIETKLNTRWTGVRSCSRRSVAGRAIMSKLERWATAQMREHRGLQFLRYNLDGPARYRWENRRNRWTGKRSCTGWSTFAVYIEFKRP